MACLVDIIDMGGAPNMVYKGHIKNGVVVIDQDAALPEGTEVTVKVARVASNSTKASTSPEPETFQEFLLTLAGKAEGLPADLAINHDHYLYGTPKVKE
jgi:hypothetical protein